MKIICITPVTHLDGIVDKLESFGEVHYFQNINKDTLVKKIDEHNYDVIFCNPNKQTFILDGEVLKNFDGTILTASTGLNHIDIEYCRENKINVLSHTEDMELLNNLPSTSELAFGLMLSILRNIPSGFDDVKDGGWDYDKFMGHQLRGKSVGIIGLGRLGTMMYDYCNAFGMNVYIYDPYKGYDDLDTLLKESDIISLHVHANDETRHMIDKKTLGKMKNNSYIVNTSRGEIVNEKDIVQSLKDGKLKGYATDVIEDEYGNRDESPIIKGIREDLNIIVTPHIGGMTWEGQQKAYEWSTDKLIGIDIYNSFKEMK